jgi:hypothetical protein
MKKTALSLLLFLFCLGANAQEAFVNSGGLKIFNGASITSFGNFTNNASSAFVNDGEFYIKGNISNSQSSISIGPGTLVLNGAATQSINGSQPFKTYHLTTDNSTGIILNNNLHISGTHTFTSGIITSSATPNYLVYESGASYSGTADDKHVNGWVKKIGSADFTFPTGDGTHLRPVDITNLASNSEFDARYNGAILSSARTTQAPLVSVNPSEYWTVDRISGGTAQVKLNWDHNKVAFPNYVIADIRTSWYSGTAWTNTGGTATGNTTSTGTITSNSLSTFGRFAIASVSYVIPLRFLGIEAKRENSSVKINWQTANEVAVNYYEIQRSIDGSNFTTVGNLNAKNLDIQSYSFIDPNAPASKLFYRIKANDLDGSVRYSKTAMVIAIDQNQYIELLNNPVQSSIQLTAHNVKPSVYSYQLINSAGQVCKKGIINVNGTSTITIPLAVIPGDYTLILNNSKERQQFKLVVL